MNNAEELLASEHACSRGPPVFAEEREKGGCGKYSGGVVGALLRRWLVIISSPLLLGFPSCRCANTPIRATYTMQKVDEYSSFAPGSNVTPMLQPA